MIERKRATIRVVTLALTAAALVGAAPQTSQGDVARRQIKAQLESVRAPLFNGGAAVPGYTATYSVDVSGCRSSIDIAIPNHVAGGRQVTGNIERVAVDWSKVQSVRTSNAYVIVAAPGLPAAGRYFFAGSNDGAVRLKAAMDTLAGACFGPAANPAPTNVAAVSERVPEKADILGTPQCRFRQVPELLLTDNKPPVVKTAVYRVRPREGGDKDSRFGIGAQSGEQVENWEGILADPQIVLYHQAHESAEVTRSVVTVDGRAIAVPVKPYHPKAGWRPGFNRSVSVSPTSYNPGGLLREIARGSLMEVRLYAGSRLVSQWSFDVHTLRLMPAALKGARWTCR